MYIHCSKLWQCSDKPASLVAQGGAALDLARQRDTFMLVEIIIAIAIDSF